jgi:hypothetical protein
MRKIEILLDQMALQVPHNDVLKSSVSSVTVGWHIHHSILVITEIIKSVTHSDPKNFVSSFNFKKWIVFTTGKFPRGKAPAPNVVKPSHAIQQDDFQALLNDAKKALIDLENTQKNQYFTHPIFGKLNVQGTWKMLTIHTQHHLLIINDILKP